MNGAQNELCVRGCVRCELCDTAYRMEHPAPRPPAATPRDVCSRADRICGDSELSEGAARVRGRTALLAHMRGIVTCRLVLSIDCCSRTNSTALLLSDLHLGQRTQHIRHTTTNRTFDIESNRIRPFEPRRAHATPPPLAARVRALSCLFSLHVTYTYHHDRTRNRASVSFSHTSRC